MCGILAAFGLEGHPGNYEKDFLENVNFESTVKFINWPLEAWLHGTSRSRLDRLLLGRKLYSRPLEARICWWNKRVRKSSKYLANFIFFRTQPLSSYDSSIVCIANGEIYNYKFIWKQLDKIDPMISKITLCEFITKTI